MFIFLNKFTLIKSLHDGNTGVTENIESVVHFYWYSMVNFFCFNVHCVYSFSAMKSIDDLKNDFKHTCIF